MIQLCHCSTSHPFELVIQAHEVDVDSVGLSLKLLMVPTVTLIDLKMETMPTLDADSH
jgi:hypothetical protein